MHCRHPYSPGNIISITLTHVMVDRDTTTLAEHSPRGVGVTSDATTTRVQQTEEDFVELRMISGRPCAVCPRRRTWARERMLLVSAQQMSVS